MSRLAPGEQVYPRVPLAGQAKRPNFTLGKCDPILLLKAKADGALQAWNRDTTPLLRRVLSSEPAPINSCPHPEGCQPKVLAECCPDCALGGSNSEASTGQCEIMSRLAPGEQVYPRVPLAGQAKRPNFTLGKCDPILLLKAKADGALQAWNRDTLIKRVAYIITVNTYSNKGLLKGFSKVLLYKRLINLEERS